MKKKLALILGCLLVPFEAKSIDPITGLVVFGGSAVAYAARRVTMKNIAAFFLFQKFAQSSTGKKVMAASAKIIKKDFKAFLFSIGRRVSQPLLAAREKVQVMLPIAWRSKELPDATGKTFVADRCKVEEVSQVVKDMTQAFQEFKKTQAPELVVQAGNNTGSKRNWKKAFAGAAVLGAGWYANEKRKNRDVAVSFDDE